MDHRWGDDDQAKKLKCSRESPVLCYFAYDHFDSGIACIDSKWQF